jgi:hypothetical protein
MTPMTSILTARAALAAFVALGALAGGQGEAEAGGVSARVKLACAGDYFSYCSQHSPTSPAVRQCMRANGLKLSSRCVNALVAAGEVSAEEVSRRQAAK